MTAAAVLERVRSHGRWATAEVVAKDLGISTSGAKYRLAKLVEAGLVRQRIAREAASHPRYYVRTPNEVWPPVRRAYYEAVEVSDGVGSGS